MESSGEGVDPLESLDKTLLNIAGNSTQLARWDTKLGRQNTPFVAGLSSLSVDGGNISLMDVIIDRLYPVAYTASEKGKMDTPWGEVEERQLQDAWTVSCFVQCVMELIADVSRRSTRLNRQDCRGI